MKDYPEIALAATSGNVYDGYAALKALLYAIGCIQSLPGHRQERSDMIEMCAMVRRLAGSREAEKLLLPTFLWSVEHHLCHKIDLWPAHGGAELNGAYSDEELDWRDAVRAWIDEREALFQLTGAVKDAPPSNVVKFMDDHEAV